MFISSKVAVQTSKQTKAPLLCKECEDLINKQGERWTLPRIANEDKSFPLHTSLVTAEPDFVQRDMVGYSAAKNSEIDVQALTHFALAIFWKASVHNWHDLGSDPQIDLGPYEEKLRGYVRNPRNETFPDHVTLLITLLPPANVPLLTNIPVRAPGGEGFRNYKFYIPGIQFVLSVGKTVDDEVCFYNNPLHFIWVSDIRSYVERSPARLIAQGSTAKQPKRAETRRR